ncbi:septum site-determining protein MinC [Hydrogenivirga caldilitoris]|uniref:Probable septum site-determining protein MinC n=1 Tax=Hydrogenivirga caldilitoris TaxID=246264 RepID=A0A497XSN4_9AQUI|nr:septum site-determining protein MinC [Hydrogenivirga caldilitoris]RLJ71170.1 septum site-determining protein MinC [Hydrogenivirga caldilitoris]
MVEIKGVTLPVIAIRIKETKDLNSVKEEIKSKVKGKLFQGSYFILENAEELPENWLPELESFLKEMSLENISRMGRDQQRETKCDRLLVVDRSLRSGQKVEHGGDVLVLGDVNKDAEVIAVGNIIIMGALRGIAIAGALGDENAVVVAMKMEPQQIRIGKKIAISDESERVSPGYPEVARVEDGMIVLEKV